MRKKNLVTGLLFAIYYDRVVGRNGMRDYESESTPQKERTPIRRFPRVVRAMPG